MNKKDLSERDICSKFIGPAVKRAGWDGMMQIREEVAFTKGRIIVRGKLVTRGKAKRADYILYYKPNIPIAIVEAKDNNHSVGDGMQQALDYAVTLLQDYTVTAIAGLSGHGKTWITLSIAKALLFGPGKLWDLFEVPQRADKIIYLIPEASRSAFKKRLKLMGLYEEVGKRLFVRTLTKGPALPLTDTNILREAKGAHIFCDTAIRFMQSADENSASEAPGRGRHLGSRVRTGETLLVANYFHRWEMARLLLKSNPPQKILKSRVAA
jgi:AAA domain